MATLTLIVDSAVLDAAKQEAERLGTTVESMMTGYLATVASAGPLDDARARLLALMREGPLGNPGPLPAREELNRRR